MVTTLKRSDIVSLKGVPRKHTPYKAEEIIAWINPCSQNIPPTKFQHAAVKNFVKSSLPKKVNCIITDQLDFGGEDGTFGCHFLVYISINSLEFGDSSGVFTPQVYF